MPKTRRQHPLLELHRAGSSRETAESGLGILEVENLGVGIFSLVHGLEAGVGIQHVNLGFQAIIFHQGAAETEPLVAGLVHGANLDLGVGGNLLGNVLGLSSLDVQFAFEDFSGTEGTNLGLISVYGCQEIGATFLEKLYYFFHIFRSATLWPLRFEVRGRTLRMH